VVPALDIGKRQIWAHGALALARLLRVLIGQIRLDVDGIVFAGLARLLGVGFDLRGLTFLALGLIVGIALVLTGFFGCLFIAFRLVDIFFRELKTSENRAR